MLSLKKFRTGLRRTREAIFGRLSGLMAGSLDEATLETLEETLIAGDVGVDTSLLLIERLRDRRRRGAFDASTPLTDVLKEEVIQLLEAQPHNGSVSGTTRPHVIVLVGVNGVGKTTTIGKLAARYRAAGERVLLAAADTYRAAAVEQLEIWGRRTGADFVRAQAGSDPAAVAFDAVTAGKSRGADVVIVDTAGRLHTRVDLMDELKKIMRVIQKVESTAPHEILLVLDANIGQNALSQAREFVKAIPVTGIVLTKLDGTARGGIVVAISQELSIPIRYLGVGEGEADLEAFQVAPFVDALFTADGE